MHRAGADPNNVQMSDVLCDFCHRAWTDDVAMIEGHHGSCICGNCLTIAYTELVMHEQNSTGDDFACTMCLETGEDREAMNRSEPGWRSPMYSEAAICRRCVKLAAGALTKDKESGWNKPK